MKARNRGQLKNGQSLDRWAWLMLDSQGSKPNIWCSQGVKHENLLGQDLDRGRGWKYRHLCSVPLLTKGRSLVHEGNYMYWAWRGCALYPPPLDPPL